MRTNEEIDEASLKIVGLHAQFLPDGVYSCAIACGQIGFEHLPQHIEYNPEFLALSPDDQDCVLQHEKGHIVSMQDSRSVNAKLYVRQEQPHKYNKWYYLAECEADLYAAKQMGIGRVLRLFCKDMYFRNRAERRKRIRNLLKAWREYNEAGKQKAEDAEGLARRQCPLQESLCK